MSEMFTASALAPRSRRLEVRRRKWTSSIRVSVVRSRSCPAGQLTTAASSPGPTRTARPGAASPRRTRAISLRSPSSRRTTAGLPAVTGSSPSIRGRSGDPVQLLLDLALGDRPDHLVHHLARFEEEEGRDRANLIPRGDPRVLVDVHL